MMGAVLSCNSMGPLIGCPPDEVRGEARGPCADHAGDALGAAGVMGAAFGCNSMGPLIGFLLDEAEKPEVRARVMRETPWVLLE